MPFEIGIVVFWIAAWIFGFWSAKHAMIGLTIWTAFCLLLTAAVCYAAYILNVVDKDDWSSFMIGLAAICLVLICGTSLTFGPILAILFGLRSKQSIGCPAQKAQEAYKQLTPEEQKRVQRGVKVTLGVAAGFLADHMESQGKKNAAHALSNFSQRNCD